MNVLVGDSVYVFGFGPGTVARILPDNGGFVVSIPGRGEKHFTVDGCIGVGTDRRVFFQNPIFIDPPKNQKIWNTYVTLATQLFTLISQLDSSGDLPNV
jgi:hypothetical protein